MSTVLANSESISREDTFTANLVLFWLKADYKLTNKRITGVTPNTLLGFIPIGKKQIAQPLKTIASVMSSTKFHPKRFVIGMIFLAIVGNTINELESFDPMALFFFIIGAVNLANSYTSTFIISNTGGQNQTYEISILEKQKVKDFVDKVNLEIAEL